MCSFGNRPTRSTEQPINMAPDYYSDPGPFNRLHTDLPQESPASQAGHRPIDFGRHQPFGTRALPSLDDPLPLPGVCRTRLHGEMQPLIYSLGALGLPRSGVLSKRPLLLGTVETEHLLHALAQQATYPTQRVKRDREAGHSAFEGWLQKLVPQHRLGCRTLACSSH